MLVNPLSALAAVLLAVVVGCGGGDDTPSGDGDIVVTPTTPNAAGGPCVKGTVRACKQIIAELDGVTSCYVGEQTCDERGGWGACLKERK